LSLIISKIGILNKRIVALKSFKKLLVFVAQTLVPQTFGMLKVNRKDLVQLSQTSGESDDNEVKTSKGKGKRKRATTKTASVQKESRLIPDLVYHMEQYEINLAKLSKLSVSCEEFIRFVHRSTSRDFKLEVMKKKASKNEKEDDDEEEEEEEEGSNESESDE